MRGMIEVPLSRGYVALIDEEDWGVVSQHKWHIHPRRLHKGEHADYAIATVRWPDRTRHTIQMHRLIMDAPAGMKIDHVDHDGLNNCRENLRLCTNSQNGMNRCLLKRPKSSAYKGVVWMKANQKWLAQIKTSPESRGYIGLFDTEIEAALAYNAAALDAFKDFALLNIIEPPADPSGQLMLDVG